MPFNTWVGRGLHGGNWEFPAKDIRGYLGKWRWPVENNLNRVAGGSETFDYILAKGRGRGNVCVCLYEIAKEVLTKSVTTCLANGTKGNVFSAGRPLERRAGAFSNSKEKRLDSLGEGFLKKRLDQKAKSVGYSGGGWVKKAFLVSGSSRGG